MNIFDLQATITLNSSGFEAGIQNAQSAMRGFSSGIGAGAVAVGNIVADMATTAASGLMDFGKDAITTGMNFDAAMSNVGAISGATGETLNELREAAIQWGGSTVFSAQDVAEAFSYMGMAGWNAEQMMAGIGGVLNLAAAGGENLAITSDIVTDALTALGYTAEDTSQFVDVLAAASVSANTDVGMMGESFKYAAPLAGTLGYSVEDLAIALGLMAGSGIKAGMAGTAFRAALSNLLKPTDDVVAAMKELGLDGGVLQDSDGNMRELSDTVDILRDAFSGLTRAEKAEYATRLFGREASNAMLAIINTTEQDYRKMTEAVYSASEAYDGNGKAAEIAAKQSDNLAGDVKKLGSAFETFKIDVETSIDAPLRNIVQTASKAVEAITKGFESGGIRGAVAALGDFVKEKLRGLWDNLKLPPAVEKIADTLKGVFDKVKAAISNLNLGAKFSGAIDGIREAFDNIKGIVEKFELGDKLNSLGDKFRDAFNRAKTALSGIDWSGAFANVRDKIIGAFNTVKDVVDKIDLAEKFAGIKDKVSAAFAKVKEVFDGIDLSSVFSGIASKVTEAFSNVAQAVEGIDLAGKFSGIKDKIAGAFNGIRDSLSNVDLGDVFSGIKDKLAGAIDAIKPEIESKIEQLKEVFSDVSGFFAGIADSFGNFDLSVFSSFGGAIEEFAGSFTNLKSLKFDEITRGIKEFVSAFDNVNIGGVIADLAGKVVTLAGAFTSVAAGVISDVADAIKEFLNGFYESDAPQFIAGIAKSVENLLSKFMLVAADVIADIGANIRDFLDVFPSEDVGKLIGSIADNVSDLFAAFGKIGEKAIEGIATALKGFWDAIPKETIGAAISDVVSVIQDLFSLFTESIVGIVERVSENFEGFGTTIANLWANAAPAFEELGTKFHDMCEKFKEAAETLFDKIKPVFDFIVDTLSGAVKGAIEGLVGNLDSIFESGGKAFDAISNGLQAFIDLLNGDGTSAAESFKQAWEDLKAYFEGLGDSFKEIGANIVNGIKEGFASAWDGFIGSVGALGNGLVDLFKGLFKEHSPSKVFADIGANLVYGLRDGWTDTFDGFERQVTRDAARITDTVRTKFEDSAIGRSSTAGINTYLAAANNQARNGTQTVNVVLDSDVIASAIYDPLQRENTRRGGTALVDFRRDFVNA